MFFNFLPGEPGSYAIVPLSAESVVKKYVDGSAQKRYDFAFQLMAPLSQTTDTVNADTLSDLRGWQAWIDEQEAAKNYPDFGEKCSNYRLENLTNTPQLAVAYTQDKMAKYQFMATIFYLEVR